MRFAGSGGVAALLAALAGVFAAPASFAEETSSPERPPKWGASLDLEGKAGTERHLGEADLLLPLAQDDRTLLFANGRFRLDDNDSWEGNVGLGLRRMLEGDWNLGTYGYFDRRRSDTGHFYNQTTFGAEVLGRDFDFRVNGYVPVWDQAHDLGSSGGGETTAALSGNTVQVTTPGTQMSEERALGGFDAEIGWRVPVFEFEEPYDFRLYAGGFYFDDSEVEAIAGPRLRAEFTAYEMPGLWQGTRVTVGAEWQDDDVRGSQGFASLRFRIPLQSEAQRSQPLTAQERRMTAPVVRDIDIVTQARTEVITPATVETATETADGGAITVLSSASTSGADLPSTVAAAGANSTVILSGTFNTTAQVNMSAGQILMGAGTLTVRTPNGKTATLTTPTAVIMSNLANNDATVEMAAGSTLAGVDISHTVPGQGTGVRAIGVSNVTITNNAINITTNAPHGIYLQDVSNFVVRGNTVTATGISGSIAVQIHGAGSSGVFRDNQANAHASAGTRTAFSLVSGGSAVVSGNTLSGSSDAVDLFNANILAGSTGNTLITGGCQSGGVNTGTIEFTNGTTCPGP